MPVLIVLYLFLVGVAALLAQMVLPVAFPILNTIGFGSALLPLVTIYASLELADERAPVLAAALGLLLDLTAMHRLGTSVLLLGGLSALIVTQARKPESESWLLRLLYVLVSTFLFLLLEYVAVLAQSGRWLWTLDVWSKITFASLFNLAASPLLFRLIGFPPKLCGWKTFNEARLRPYAR